MPPFASVSKVIALIFCSLQRLFLLFLALKTSFPAKSINIAKVRLERPPVERNGPSQRLDFATWRLFGPLGSYKRKSVRNFGSMIDAYAMAWLIWFLSIEMHIRLCWTLHNFCVNAICGLLIFMFFWFTKNQFFDGWIYCNMRNLRPLCSETLFFSSLTSRQKPWKSIWERFLNQAEHRFFAIVNGFCGVYIWHL